MIDARDYLLKVAKLKGLMNDRARGGQPLEQDYAQAREVLVTSPIRNALPNVVLSCHTLQEWWQFIKGKYPTYKERTEFLQTEFAPLLASLEQNLVPKVATTQAPRRLACLVCPGRRFAAGGR